MRAGKARPWPGEPTNSVLSQNAPPKAKYIEHLLIATHSGEAGVGEVFRAMHYRLRDSTWTVVLKGLLTVHLMIREGSQEVTLAYLSKHRNMLAISSFTDGRFCRIVLPSTSANSAQRRHRVGTFGDTPITSASARAHIAIPRLTGCEPARDDWRS